MQDAFQRIRLNLCTCPFSSPFHVLVMSQVFTHFAFDIYVIAYNYIVISFVSHSYDKNLHYGYYLITFVYIVIYVHIMAVLKRLKACL